MSGREPVTAAVILIGNEVLSGRTRDANLGYLAAELDVLGIRLKEARVIADDVAAIVEAVNACRSRYDYVFTTGGIGPTHDDITAAAIAAAFAVPLCRDARALALLRRQYAPQDLNTARLKMADIPEGATLIDNPVSKAPGFQIENVYVLPGVPAIMQAMFEGLRQRLVGGARLHSRTISAFTTEGSVAGALAELQARHPVVEIGSYPFARGGRLGVSLVVRGTDPAAVERVAEEIGALVRDAGAEPMDETIGRDAG